MTRTLRRSAALAALASCCAATAQAAARIPAPAGAAVYFQSPQEGRTRDPVLVRAGLVGMGVAPAGATAADAGHHNLLIDTKLGNPNAPLAAGANLVRLDNGETEVSLSLPRGWHQLQLVVTDGKGMNFEPPIVSPPLSIYVRRR